MKFIAHVNSENRVQSCEQHSRNVANYAKECLKTVDLENTGYLAGLLHDCGKFTEEFSEYIKKVQKENLYEKGKLYILLLAYTIYSRNSIQTINQRHVII